METEAREGDMNTMEFETLEGLVEFFEANKGAYTLHFGADRAILRRMGEDEIVATVYDDRCAGIALSLLKGMVGI